MKLSFKAVLNWLQESGDQCTIEQLKELEDWCSIKADQVRERDSVRDQALKQAEAVAKAAGFSSLSELLNISSSEATSAPGRLRSRKYSPRKAYLVPDDPNTLKAYSYFKNRTPPAELAAFIERSEKYGGVKWNYEELRYDRIGEARKKRGLPENHLWDPLERHAIIIEKLKS